jgi:hypothetical protein
VDLLKEKCISYLSPSTAEEFKKPKIINIKDKLI